jgi:hypothetical protein
MFIEKDCGTIIERVLNVGTGAEKEEKEKVDAETRRSYAVARWLVPKLGMFIFVFGVSYFVAYVQA